MRSSHGNAWCDCEARLQCETGRSTSDRATETGDYIYSRSGPLCAPPNIPVNELAFLMMFSPWVDWIDRGRTDGHTGDYITELRRQAVASEAVCEPDWRGSNHLSWAFL